VGDNHTVDYSSFMDLGNWASDIEKVGETFSRAFESGTAKKKLGTDLLRKVK